jgi:hypothetical protein
VRLTQADSWLERAHPQLTARDLAFLDASRAAALARDQAAEAARREREALLEARAAADRRNVTRLRIFLAVGGVLLLVALAFLAFAIYQQGVARKSAEQESAARTVAENQTRIAQSQARAAESLLALTNGDPDRALILARVCAHWHPNVRAARAPRDAPHP